jgi:putative flippase GtrA
MFSVLGQDQRTREFIRYVLSGGSATVVNLAAVWLSRQFASYETAVAIGALFGTATTYLMTKTFVFNARSKAVDYPEVARFLCIHGVVCLQIWLVAVSLERWILPAMGVAAYREAIASVIGVGSVVFTGYFLHRKVTYRSGRALGPGNSSIH